MIEISSVYIKELSLVEFLINIIGFSEMIELTYLYIPSRNVSFA